MICDHVDNNIKGFAFEGSLKGCSIFAVAGNHPNIWAITKPVWRASTIVEDNFISAGNQRLRDGRRYQSRSAK